MKNSFYILFALLLTVTTLTGCGKTDEAATDDKDGVEVITPGVDVSEDGNVNVDLSDVEGLEDALKDTGVEVDEDGSVTVTTPEGSVTTDADTNTVKVEAEDAEATPADETAPADDKKVDAEATPAY